MDDDGGQRIQVFRDCDAIRISQTEIQRVAEDVMRRRRRTRYALSIAVVDDATIAELHWQYLRKRGATDVLSFDLSDGPRSPLEGQIVVSSETAKQQATRRDVPARSELMLYIVHGILHLLGYDDHEPDEAKRMHRQEDRVLEALGYGRPYECGGDRPRPGDRS